jgi:hypothetical protein
LTWKLLFSSLAAAGTGKQKSWVFFSCLFSRVVEESQTFSFLVHRGNLSPLGGKEWVVSIFAVLTLLCLLC